MSGMMNCNNDNLKIMPPFSSRGSRTLNRDDFTKVFQIPALRVDAKNCALFMKTFRRSLLNQPRLRNIVPDPRSEYKDKKLVLLRPGGLLNEEEKEFIQTYNATETTYHLVLGYDFWTCEQVLRVILPYEISEVPTSFETIGHIAHLNLRENQLDYKSVIGQILLDKNSPQIKTVVNKTNTIDETFRFFRMEVLAGENNLQATVKEGGCIFKFDFSKVYWNSRLQTEHKRLVDVFSKTDVVCDMFAGVGPFAIPAAKRGCLVHANDLNPNSYEALVKNAELNKVEMNLKAYNLDGREFIKKMVMVLENDTSPRRQMFNHVIMNLPASAVQFLDVFKGLFSNIKDRFTEDKSSTSRLVLPIIHCYCFSKSRTPEHDAQSQAEMVLGVKMDCDCKVHYVRDVAPKKAMLCVSFRLPASVAFSEEHQQQQDDIEPPIKQPKLEESADN